MSEQEHDGWAVVTANNVILMQTVSWYRKDAIKNLLDSWYPGLDEVTQKRCWRQQRSSGWLKCVKVVVYQLDAREE